MADEAAMFADEAASIAEVAADEADMPADDIAPEAEASGVVTMVVDEVEGVDIVAGGVVVVVVVSSFLLQAAKETAAARVTIKTAVFIFLLGGFGFGQLRGNCGNPSVEEPHRLQDKESKSISNA